MSRLLEIKQSPTKLSDARISPLAGKPAPREMLVDLARLEKKYFDRKPDLEDDKQFVVFGTSGYRGTSLNGTFTEAHVLAITQAICEYRVAQPSGTEKIYKTYAESSKDESHLNVIIREAREIVMNALGQS
jgi:phosphoglucomutase